MFERAVFPPRKTAFILASTDHGTMIVNRFDYKMSGDNSGFGVGFKILNEGLSVLFPSFGPIRG